MAAFGRVLPVNQVAGHVLQVTSFNSTYLQFEYHVSRNQPLKVYYRVPENPPPTLSWYRWIRHLSLSWSRWIRHWCWPDPDESSTDTCTGSDESDTDPYPDSDVSATDPYPDPRLMQSLHSNSVYSGSVLMLFFQLWKICLLLGVL